MLEVIYNFFQNHLYTHLMLIALSLATIICAMIIDLFFGIRKARELGIEKDSQKLKKTADKAQKYFSPFLCLTLIDILCCVVIPIPAFSMLWAAYCIWVEFLSVREKSWKKAELRKAERTMNVIIENKDDMAKLVAQMLFEQQNMGGKKDEKGRD